jgi:hypothetical protein
LLHVAPVQGNVGTISFCQVGACAAVTRSHTVRKCFRGERCVLEWRTTPGGKNQKEQGARATEQGTDELAKHTTRRTREQVGPRVGRQDVMRLEIQETAMITETPLQFTITPGTPTKLRTTSVDGRQYEIAVSLAIFEVMEVSGVPTPEGHPLFQVKTALQLNINPVP